MYLYQRQPRSLADGSLGAPAPNASPTTLPSTPQRPKAIFDKFALGKSALDDRRRKSIAEFAAQVVATWRTGAPIRRVRLVGHTDDSGDADFNLKLGTERAKSVAAELTNAVALSARGLSTTIDRRFAIETDTRGEAEPIVRTPTQRDLNRRVEAFVLFSITPIPPIPPPPPRKDPVITGQPPPPVTTIPWVPWRPQPPGPPLPPSGPGIPTRPPGVLILPPPKNTGSGIPDWIKLTLTAGATALGMVMSTGVWALKAATLEKAIEAAWLALQLEQGGLRAAVGLAGEWALEAILPDVLGVDPSLVLNLNKVATSFPILDVMAPSAIVSVKVYGLVSKRAGLALTKGITSSYINDFLDILDGGVHSDSALDRCAQLLFDNQAALRKKGVWPKAMRGTSVQSIRSFVQRETFLGIPNDHVQMVRKELGRMLNAERVAGKRSVSIEWIQQQTFRIRPAGISSKDLSALIESVHDLPRAQAERLQREHAQLIRDRAKRGP
jgi:outer membrane protein OmpA-like peptidoglycan-associated protein